MSKKSGKVKLTIGRLAEQAGVNVETIRYYQRIGLVKEPNKPETGFREYPSDYIEQIQFIRRAQQLGFNLGEIAELLELGDGHCNDVRIKAEQKRNKIARQIADLRALQQTLDQLINACNSGNDQQPCPIVETLLEKNKG